MTEREEKSWEADFDRFWKRCFEPMPWKAWHAVTDKSDFSRAKASQVKDFITSIEKEAREEERKSLKNDMRRKMFGWHGRGEAMVDDYFKSLSNQ